MATQVVRSFDLYNTTFYWNGYTGIVSLSTELNIAQAYYIAQYSANPVGSLIDFFAELAGQINQNPCFTVNTSGSDLTTISTLPYLWAKYWWDEAMFYTLNLVASALTINYPQVYQQLSDSIGSLYFLSRSNNLLNNQTIPYNSLVNRLIVPNIASNIQSFYQTANSLFVTNIAAIGPAGTDTAPNNSNLIMADTDLTRMITGVTLLTAAINLVYSAVSSFLSFNTTVIGNLITPINWTTSMPYEQPIGIITVDLTNSNIANPVQLTMNTLIYQSTDTK